MYGFSVDGIVVLYEKGLVMNRVKKKEASLLIRLLEFRNQSSFGQIIAPTSLSVPRGKLP
jgi:hypothetical protein